MKFFKYLFSTLMLFTSMQIFADNYYWVGGSGNWTDINHWRTTSGGTSTPSVIPGPTDNVFFDVNSGFTTTSKTVTINNTANTHDIIFSGSAVSPILTQSGTQTLNIYGSSEWQSGMGTISVDNIYYRHTGEAKTIKSNGVTLGLLNVYLEEKKSISLSDDLLVNYLNVQAGTWNTNNYRVTISQRFYASGDPILNLGSSEIFLNNSSSIFSSGRATVNAGTSHIYFTQSSTNGMVATSTQTFYNVTFQGPTGLIAGGATYNRVEFKNNGIISNSNTFNNLILSSTKTYTFQSGQTQTIKSIFSAKTVQCGGWSTITSNTAGSQSNITASSGVSIDVSGVIMKDIKASGGATFTAVNSVDNGNNAGWTFPAYTGQNLYWVGGSGNWNDKVHWSQTSGGIGGYCVPGPADNTFFDVGSGFTTNNKTVTVDNVSYTHNITFSGSAVSPILTQSGTQTLNIYGSSEWQSGMGTISVDNIYYRHTGEAKTIKSNGVTLGLLNVYLEEKKSISLSDDLLVNYLNVQAGTWNTNNYRVTISQRFYASGDPILNLGSSEIFLNNSSSIFSSGRATVNAGTSHIYFTQSSTNGMVATSTQTFYNVTFQGPTGLIAGGATYNRVEFKNNGIISNSNTFNNLILSSTKTYTFQSGQTQTIKSIFSAKTVQCGGWSTITSNTAGSQSNITASSGVSIDVSGVIMKDIKASGGATFTAVNSVDNGNNAGWTFPAYTGQNLYWVGGSGNWNDKVHWSQTSGGIGGYCVPGPLDNTFFDSGSSFTSASKTVTVDNVSYTHNILFSGSAVSPILTQSGTQTLNIHGSSEWQNGMGTISVSNIYYRHTGEAKTIKSNGVTLGNNSNGIVYFEEENSISLLDNFVVGYELFHQAGTWNTNSYQITINGRFFANGGTKPRTMNMGSSKFYMLNNSAYFQTNSAYVTINAGTSHIYFTGNLSSSNGLIGYSGQSFYNITFEIQANGSLVVNLGTVNYNRVEFKGNGKINGANSFKDLIFAAGKTYTLDEKNTQTIENWVLGGTPCDVTFVQSSTAGTRASINVTGDVTNFNFGNLKDVNASGKTLHFGEQSTIKDQNNNNITYDPYKPGAFEGLGPDWLNHQIVNNDPSTYILSANQFYGNNYTSYNWYKLVGVNSSSTTVISTDKQIDIRQFGYGTYQVDVRYSNGNTVTCQREDQIVLKGLLKKILVNPSTRIRVY